ncbi:zinc-dependent metalloprotease family protein [Acaryochloris marina]|uniref:Bacterial pre-peptidase C-terminal domain protein n=1 Tax=Acaryochloris marina (strain MBIC 11017) TaxID=329726 RepID=B0C9C3_ACAM1|nr:zinc-dependent metalloprotease family protein [Acaryochloris marina]ABW27804.1 bacterial pre-peptidase C-terminal domain protein [Acaryochloris marina MBIC11017]
MTNPANLQQSSDVISSDLDHDKNSDIKFSSSNTAAASNNRKEDNHLSKAGIKPSQFSIEALESLSTEGVSFQQGDSVEQYRFEQYLSSKTFSLSPNLTSLLTPTKQQASCSKCGQVGCACSSNQAQPNQQDNNPASSGHNHYHGSTSHTHGLEGDFPVWNTAGTSASNAPSSSLAVGNTFRLHSNPNAQHTIYLDFDGHTTSGTWWNNGGTIRSSAYDRDGNSSSFSTSELLEIQSIWQQVAEDFAPFNVNVTTQDPGAAALSKTSSSDRQWGVRVLFTDNRNDLDGSAIAAGAGGVAYIGSFNRNVDQPVFVFNKGARAAAVTASHEVGHSLYLSHDGISGQTDYHPGHGNGATSWGSIMGAPFQESLTQWSKGDYYNASNKEDDLALITTRNGFGYRSDDHGNSQGNASALSLNNAGQMSAFGTIERNTDVDYFSFTIGTGDVSFTITPTSKAFVGNGSGGYATEYLDAQGANLDIWAGLYNSNGTLLASSNPSNLLTASLDLSLTAGTYFIRIDGVGKDNPLVSGSQGYSDYGSLGQYSILGSVESLDSRVIEGSGTASLLTTAVGYQIQGQGETAQFVRLNGNVVSENTFSGWSAIGVEKLGQGFQLLWKNVDGRYLDWRVDAKGTYQSSQSISQTELTNLETTFLQDLNGDTQVGWASTAIEAVGTASLLTTAVGYQIQGQGETAQFVRLNGNVVSENTFSGWSAIGVEKLGQGFQLLWKNIDGRYLSWRVDAKGTYQSSQSISQTELTNLETTFLQDLNGDTQMGWASTAIEAVGTASLLTTAVGYQIQGQGEMAQFVRLNGNVVSENTFSGWSAIGVEKLGQGFQLLWKNVDGRYLSWRVDAKGTYQSSQSISQTELTNLETTFLQDLNGDQRIEQAAPASNLRHNDLLLGGPSNQMLVGSARNDFLIQEDSSNPFILLNITDGIDTITNFIPGKDLIQISATDLGWDVGGDIHLASEQFGLGVGATTHQQRFLYDQLSGYLRYDADGIDSIASIHIATFSSKPELFHQDIQLVL